MTNPQPCFTPNVRFTANARTVLLGLWGEMDGPGRWDGATPIQAAKPLSEQDAANGMIHAKTGIWFPEHQIIDTDEGRVPIPFAGEQS